MTSQLINSRDFRIKFDERSNVIKKSQGVLNSGLCSNNLSCYRIETDLDFLSMSLPTIKIYNK